MTQYGSSWFGEKGGKPAGVFEHPAFEDDEEKRRAIREDLNNIIHGRENWHSAPVLWDGIKYKEIQVDPEKA